LSRKSLARSIDGKQRTATVFKSEGFVTGAIFWGLPFSSRRGQKTLSTRLIPFLNRSCRFRRAADSAVAWQGEVDKGTGDLEVE
jgi:hypothetical protein